MLKCCFVINLHFQTILSFYTCLLNNLRFHFLYIRYTYNIYHACTLATLSKHGNCDDKTKLDYLYAIIVFFILLVKQMCKSKLYKNYFPLFALTLYFVDIFHLIDLYEIYCLF